MLTKEVHKQLVTFAKEHQKADEYISGRYEWNRGACAIGCAVHDCKRIGLIHKNVDAGNHAKLAEVTGIPEMILRLEDHIFEGLKQSERIKWPVRFWKAVQPGKDYSLSPARIMAKFAGKLAKDAIRDDVKLAAKLIKKLWKRRAAGDDPSKEEWDAAWQQADAAWQRADAAMQQAYAARQQADAARQKAYAASQQAGAASQQYWQWCADVVIAELSACYVVKPKGSK